MGKFGKYKKKYKKDWERLPEFQGWLQQNVENQDGQKEAHCKVCKTDLRAQKFDLMKHGTTRVHRGNMDKLNSCVQKKLPLCGITSVTNENKLSDLKLAIYIATQSAIRSIDHLGEMLTQLGKGSQLEKLRMHRTKCSKLITGVIAPAMLTELISDVGDKGYSLILDESTDVSVHKYMALCIRYFSSQSNDIVTDFLGIIEVNETTAIALYNSVTEYVEKAGLYIKNLIGIGTDGASNLCGKNHSLYTLLKELVPLPQLQLVKCICHSLHLCSSKASAEMPSSLEFLIRETRNWFSNSSLRRMQYKDLFNAINDNNKAFLNLVQLSNTRWLAWEGAVKRILSQWLELKTHFELHSQSKEKSYTAKVLYSMFKDSQNYLYLIFLRPILHDVNATNILFQRTHQEFTEIYQDLRLLLMSVAGRIIKPAFLDNVSQQSEIDCVRDALTNELALLPINLVDFGIEFREQAAKLKLPDKDLTDVQYRCCRVLHVLCTELVKRMPENVAVLQTISKISPENVLSQIKKPSVNDLPLHFAGNIIDRSAIEIQLRKLTCVDWTEHFPKDVIQSSTKFWSSVHVFKDAGGRQPFKELALFALRLLSLPLSNAVVERVFSIMNGTKTKSRNKINFCTLDALLRIRCRLNIKKECCNKFVPSQLMLQKFNSQIYDTPKLRDNTSSSETNCPDELDETLSLFAADEREEFQTESGY